jgi:hypothetical protein
MVLTKKFVKDGVSHSILYEIITARQGHHKFCTGQVPKVPLGVHKTQRTASAFMYFLEQYHKDGIEFLHHIV